MFRKSQPIIAAIQMCSSANIHENLATAAKLIQEAAANHANVVVLPEMFAIIGTSPHDKLLEKEPLRPWQNTNISFRASQIK